MPLIKWTGSKRHQAKEILQHFPLDINTYYEPFCGGASIFATLVETPEIKVNRFVLSDKNSDLIKLYQLVKYSPDLVISFYKQYWIKLNKETDTLEQQQACFYNMRERYNQSSNLDERALCLLCLSRTCFNGLIRYNPKGNFNASFHNGRPGINPDELEAIIQEWHKAFNDNNVEIKNASYEEIIKDAKIGDFIYMDPPYMNTTGMYFADGLDFDAYFTFLTHNLKDIDLCVSFDGKTGDDDRTAEISDKYKFYNEHIYVNSGKSSFKRLTGKNADVVADSLYIKVNSKQLKDLAKTNVLF